MQSKSGPWLAEEVRRDKGLGVDLEDGRQLGEVPRRAESSEDRGLLFVAEVQTLALLFGCLLLVQVLAEVRVFHEDLLDVDDRVDPMAFFAARRVRASYLDGLGRLAVLAEEREGEVGPRRLLFMRDTDLPPIGR